MEAAWGDILDTAYVSESDVHADLIDGATLGEMAGRVGTNAIDVMVELSVAEDLQTRFTIAMINDNEDEIGQLLRNDRFLLGLSDAGAHTSQLCDANYATYLLQHWWRERGDISPREGGVAPHRPAGRGLRHPRTGSHRPRAGRRRRRRSIPTPSGPPGPDGSTTSPVGADRLVADSTGIDHVFVGGVATRRDGEQLTGHGAGRLIRGRDAP